MSTITISGFIKIGKEDHIKTLYRRGLIFSNTVEYFQKVEEDELRRDSAEGAESSVRANIHSMTLKDGTVLPIKFRNTRLNTFNEETRKTHLFCVYLLTPDFATGEPFIDPKNEDFGDTALIISNPGEFLKRMEKTSKKFGLQALPVNYYKLDDDYKDLTVFDKSEKFRYQNEFRFHFSYLDTNPLKFQIGDLSDISTIVEANKLKELTFKF